MPEHWETEQSILAGLWVVVYQTVGGAFQRRLGEDSLGESRHGSRRRGKEMKVTAILVLRAVPNGEKVDPVVLANASDVSQFGFFQRGQVKEFILFVARTIASRTPNGRRQSVEQDEYMVHCYNRNGLCGLAFVDREYPMRSAFSVINKTLLHIYELVARVLRSIRKVLDEYTQKVGNAWQRQTTDSTEPWPYLVEALQRYQNPTEADKLLKIQKDLDETKIILHKTIDSVLARGEKLDTLVDKSTDLSAASQLFYKQARKTNQCCSIL